MEPLIIFTLPAYEHFLRKYPEDRLGELKRRGLDDKSIFPVRTSHFEKCEYSGYFDKDLFDEMIDHWSVEKLVKWSFDSSAVYYSLDGNYIVTNGDIERAEIIFQYVDTLNDQRLRSYGALWWKVHNKICDKIYEAFIKKETVS